MLVSIFGLVILEVRYIQESICIYLFIAIRLIGIIRKLLPNFDKQIVLTTIFRWHQKGIYDLPALVDYVIKTTGYEKIFMIGYSEGTTDITVLCTERPEYNDKIKLAIYLAPSVYLGHTTQMYLKTYAPQMKDMRVNYC